MVYQLRRGTVIFAMSFSTTNRGTAQHWFHSFQKLWLMRSIDSQTFDSHRPKELTLLNLLFKLICHVLELISHCSVIHVFNRIVKKEERKGILKWWTVSLRWQTKSSWRYQNKYHYEEYISTCSCWWSVGTLRSNDADDNENVKKTIGLISKTAISHVHHTFLYLSSPFLHDCDVKMPNFAFYGGHKQATTKFYFSFWAWLWSLEIQLQEGSPTIDKVSG